MPLAFAAAIVPLLITSASAGQYPGTSITIDNYTTIVIRVDDAMLKGLRRTMNTQTISSDLDALIRLNADYIESVKKSDVGRFREILADDFLCSLPDGTLIDREQFLAQTAKPYTLGHLEAHDVNVRVLGDVAIVHATTLFWSTSTTLTSMTGDWRLLNLERPHFNCPPPSDVLIAGCREGAGAYTDKALALWPL